MKNYYSIILFHLAKTLAMLGSDIGHLRNGSQGNLRILLTQLLRDLAHLHSNVRNEAVKVTTELLKESIEALEISDRKLQEKEQDLQ